MPAQFALNPQILKSVPLFSSFSDSQLAQLLSCVQHRSYPRNAFILRAGEETDALYIILSGRVKVLIPDEEGNEVILSVIGPHEFFGEMGLLDELPRSASVETLESCEMLRISKAGFTGILKDNFELAMLIIRNLVQAPARSRPQDREPGADRRLRPGGAPADRHGGERRRQVDRGAGAAEAGDRPHDRRLARDGEPRGEGPARKRASSAPRSAGSTCSTSSRCSGEPRSAARRRAITDVNAADRA